MKFTPAPKPSHNRRTPKRAAKGKFSTATIQAIFERDNYACVRCGTSQNLESVPHHILYRSQLGLGEINNGATCCRECHRLAHEKREVRLWFEQFKLRMEDQPNDPRQT